MDSAAFFTDSHGREWSLAFSIGSARAIKQRLRLDFANVWDGKALSEVGNDADKLASVLWTLCQSQAKERDIAEEAFYDGLGGDALEMAAEALEEAIVLFCQPAKRPALREMLTQAKAATEQMTTAAIEKLRSEKMQAAVASQVQAAGAAMDAKISSLTTSGLQSGD